MVLLKDSGAQQSNPSLTLQSSQIDLPRLVRASGASPWGNFDSSAQPWQIITSSCMNCHFFFLLPLAFIFPMSALSQDKVALCGFQVVVVLQQVFALIQTVLSKWLNDSQVVEVSRCGVGRDRRLMQNERDDDDMFAISPSGGVRHLRKVCQDTAARLCSHGVSAEWDARADVQHDSTGLRPRPHATGTHSNTHQTLFLWSQNDLTSSYRNITNFLCH